MNQLAEAQRLFLEAVRLQERGELDRAERLYKSALALAPERPSVMNNLAAVLLGKGEFAEAEVLCKRLLQINPRDETALLNLGNCRLKLNRPGEALDCYDRALGLKPDYADALSNRGNALLELKRAEEALASCDRALAIRPDHAGALNNRGNSLMDLSRAQEALASYDRALAIVPGHAEALCNRGGALRELGRAEEALPSYDRALAVKPGYAEALNGRAVTLFNLGRKQEALADWGRALEIKPDLSEALSNRGDTLLLLNRQAEAIEDFSRLLAIDPDYSYALGQRVHCKMHVCDWRNLEQELADLSVRVRAGKRASAPFPLLAMSASAAEQLQCARTWSLHKHPPSSSPLWRGERYRHDRIRVGYMSGEFREHATAYLVAELLGLHDRSRFEVFAISTGAQDGSSMSGRIARACEHYLDVSARPDREVAAQLRDREIDILLDLNGYFGGARTGILALRPAPVQVNYLGFPGTMGADYMDYIIGDPWVIPEGERRHYSEQVVYLPDSYQVNDSKRAISPRTPARAEAGLPDGGFVFCCFNNNHKIMPGTFDIWMRLLGRVEDSVLWLLQGNATVSANLRREAQRRGVAPERILLAPRVKLEDHLARHRLADLFLDTLPHNAHTTASDALWAGVPVLTCLGTTFAGRVAGSLLSAVGLPELVTRSGEEYEALALKLAVDAPLLADIKANLARNRATFPLFDTDRFRRHIEAAYVAMWERAQRGEPPAGFAVPRRVE